MCAIKEIQIKRVGNSQQRNDFWLKGSAWGSVSLGVNEYLGLEMRKQDRWHYRQRGNIKEGNESARMHKLWRGGRTNREDNLVVKFWGA